MKLPKRGEITQPLGPLCLWQCCIELLQCLVLLSNYYNPFCLSRAIFVWMFTFQFQISV